MVVESKRVPKNMVKFLFKLINAMNPKKCQKEERRRRS
jgi:hypothetical protein